MTEDVELDDEISVDDKDKEGNNKDKEPRDSPSIEGAKPEENQRPASRIIVVTPQPGSLPDKNGDDEDADGELNDEAKDSAPEKPPVPSREPSPVPSLQSSSGRSASPDEDPVQKKKGGSSTAPKFNNEVQPMEYIRPVAGGHNRAISSVHCKAMLIIMTASILIVIVVIGMVILQGKLRSTALFMMECRSDGVMVNPAMPHTLPPIYEENIKHYYITTPNTRPKCGC